ncbi:hypothetical protein Pan110_59410 [Gimesia panareensis]|nr:hypothetical protein Pan110_59410 [Gimesia panareensis]
MFNAAQSSPGQWFDCLNVGDDYEPKDDRRKDKNLTIPPHSIVEIVGVKLLGETTDNISSADHFVLEVRLPVGGSVAGRDETASEDETTPQYVTIGKNFAFTGPSSIDKLRYGRLTFPPCLCRFEGDVGDTAKIQGRYVRPEKSDLPVALLDLYESLFGTGSLQQLIGDPKGHLKIPDVEFIQKHVPSWNASGIYKYYTGEKTKGKPDDKDTTKNLLAMITPAEQNPPSGVIFLTKEPVTNQTFQAGNVAVDLLEYVDPSSPGWNHKFLLDFSGVFGHEYAFSITDGYGTTIGPFIITTDGSDIKDALESLFWVGEDNVTVHTPGPLTGRFIIEFVGELSGVRVPQLYWQRVVIESTPPANLLGGVPEIPPITQQTLAEYDYRILPGTHSVQITPASRPMTRAQLWYGYDYGVNNPYWNYGWGYYPGGGYNFYGGYGGGPFGYYGGYYWNNYGLGGSFYNGYYGPYGNYTYLLDGPFNRDEDGNVVGESPLGTDGLPTEIRYNQYGYNQYGFDVDGIDPAGFDVNGLNSDGETWGYYGVWGHLHTGVYHANHKNDHGVINYTTSNVFQHIAAGSFGVATWVKGGGYVVTEIENREFWLDTNGEPARLVAY